MHICAQIYTRGESQDGKQEDYFGFVADTASNLEFPNNN